MQYLYTLTSSPNDSYYEQFLLSITSLKLKMPNADITLLCDTKTKDTLTGKRSEYEKLIAKTIIADAPALMPQVEVSRWVKTSMRRLVQGDFLFIDCDTIVTDNLSSVRQLGIILGVCLDKHCLIGNHEKSANFIQNDKQLGFCSYLSNRHFNSGVIFCADTPEAHKIFDRWHELWLFSKSKNIVRDQPALNMAIYENLSHFSELDGTWNCQIAHNGLPYLANSKIIHYFASDNIFKASLFTLASNEIFKKIKDTGIVPDEAFELLKNPKAAFATESRIIAGNTMLTVINSDFFEFIYLLRKKAPRIFKFFNQLCAICKKAAKYYMVKKSRDNDGGTKFYN
ncbi:MAG: glycosyltransferase [Treponema sp.]|nr:glycosyltransferase [Treponema sp.]